MMTHRDVNAPVEILLVEDNRADAIEEDQADAALFIAFLSADAYPPLVSHVTRLLEAECRLAEATDVDFYLPGERRRSGGG